MLFREELFLAPLVCRGADVVFYIVLGDQRCGKALLLRYASSCNATRIEGKLPSRQENPFEFVPFPRYVLLPHAKQSLQALGKNAPVQREAGLHQQLSSLLWFIDCVWTWPPTFCICYSSSRQSSLCLNLQATLTVLNGDVLPTHPSFWWRF